MKQKLFTLLLALVTSVGVIYAESGTCGASLTWDLTDGVLTISGTGQMDNYNTCSACHAPWWKYYNLIKSVRIEEGVTRIGEYAFYGCGSMNSVTISNSVTSIGEYAFYGCGSMNSVTISNSVTTIGGYAFYACAGLTSVTIPSSVTTIGGYAFYACAGLTSVIIPNNVTSIGEYAFLNCTSLTSIEISSSVTSIGRGAFSGYNSLTSVTCLADVPPTLGNNVFSNYPQINLYIPIDSRSAYYTANGWREFFLGNSFVILTRRSESSNWFYMTSNFATTSPKRYQAIDTGTSDLNSVQKEGLGEEYYWAITEKRLRNSKGQYSTWTSGNSAEFDSIGIDLTIQQNEDETYTFSFVDGETTRNLALNGSDKYDYFAYYKLSQATINRLTVIYVGGYVGGDKDINSLNVHSLIRIAFVDWDGTVLKLIYQEIGKEVIAPENPSREGYTFIGWDKDFSSVTSNQTITAQYKANVYTIKFLDWDNTLLQQSDVEYGTTPVYAGQTPSRTKDNEYRYIFAGWSPDLVAVTGDATYTAKYDCIRMYTITTNANHGIVSGGGKYDVGAEVTLAVTPEYGYHFTQWSDGNTENPRTIILTQDTTFSAEFAIDKSGTCGKDNLLQWTFADDGILTISGSGELTENYTFGVEAPTQMQTLIVGNEVTAIGNEAFKGKTTLQKIVIGSNVTSIGNYAFADINHRQLTSLVMPAELLSIGGYAFSGNTYIENIDFNAKLQTIGAYAFNDCYRVAEMTCLATTTPDLGTNALTSISSYASLCVPVECMSKYKVDPNWGRFALCTLGSSATTTVTQGVTVEPTDNTAVFTWPTENNAASYSLQITKDGVVFCTLVFNSDGQLIGIAFAPSRDDAQHAPAATMSIAGMSFTVTGLNSASKYAYHLAVKDANENEVQAYSGEFATTGYTGEVNPGGEPEHGSQAVDNILGTPDKATKILHNGKLFILRGDKVYTTTGQEVK